MDREDNNQEDSQLIKLFLENDNSGFNRLVIKYQDQIHNLCLRFLGEREEALDCAQETFVKVYRSLKSFKGKAAFSTWLYQIAINTCRSRLVSWSYKLKRGAAQIDAEIVDQNPSPLDVIEQKEREEAVQKAINCLPADQKAVIVLCDIEGMAYEQIVKITGYKLGTVKSKIARGREKLEELLKGKI
ncbi:MAG: sigma-70 family RNA polymerase sigma factor [Candidatus Margulisiibacteriota bacterium]